MLPFRYFFNLLVSSFIDIWLYKRRSMEVCHRFLIRGNIRRIKIEDLTLCACRFYRLLASDKIDISVRVWVVTYWIFWKPVMISVFCQKSFNFLILILLFIFVWIIVKLHLLCRVNIAHWALQCTHWNSGKSCHIYILPSSLHHSCYNAAKRFLSCWRGIL